MRWADAVLVGGVPGETQQSGNGREGLRIDQA